MGKYFGTDGFRGEANVQLTVDNAFKVGPVSYTHLNVIQSVKCKFDTVICYTSLWKIVGSDLLRTITCTAVSYTHLKIEAEIEERIEAYIDGEIEELPLARKEDIGRTVAVSYTHLDVYKRQALQSVRTLFDLINRKKVVKRQILGGTLIERESTRKL